MGWEKIVEEIDKRYSFLKKIAVSREDVKSDSIHPVLKFSTGLAISTLTTTHPSRIVIGFPNRFDLDKWITVFSTLELIKQEYSLHRSDQFDFEKGQKLLFNNKYVVEFDGFEEGKVWVKTSDTTARFGLHISRILQLQPTNRKRLSSLKKVRHEYYKAPEAEIDALLGIHTTGNRALFQNNVMYVGRVGRSVKFIETHSVNGVSLVDLFLWGKLNSEGELSVVGRGKIKATPSALIAPDLYSVTNYPGFDDAKTKTVIISSPSFCLNNLSSFNTLLDSQKSIIILTDYPELNGLETFREHGFQTWLWNKSNLLTLTRIIQSTTNSLFAPFHRTLTNLCTQEVDTIDCCYPKLDSVTAELMKLNHCVHQTDEVFQGIFSRLFQLHNQLLRLIIEPPSEWRSRYHAALEDLGKQIEEQRLWIPPEMQAQLDRLITSLQEVSESSFDGCDHKLMKLDQLLEENSVVEKTIVVVPRFDDLEEIKKYWTIRFSKAPEKLKGVEFVPAAEVAADALEFLPGRIIVGGWLGQTKMFSIIHSFLTNKFVLLLYPRERIWFERAMSRWQHQRKVHNNSKELIDQLGLSIDASAQDEPQPEEPTDSVDAILEEDIGEIERRVREYKYAGYKADNSSAETIESCKPVTFNEDYLAFFTKTHKCLAVTGLVLGVGSQREIEKLTLADLKTGEYVLFFNSDKDMIREIADGILAKKGKPDLRNKATFWQSILQKKTQELSLDTVVRILHRQGCKRHRQTIRNWLEADEMIGPADREDIKRILKAFATKLVGDDMEEMYQEINEAISEVRGAHHHASALLEQRLLSLLPGMLSYRGELCRPLTIDLQDFGTVTILRVEEIGANWIKVEKHHVNRLLH